MDYKNDIKYLKKYTFMPDMLASMYFKTEDPMTGKLFKFQPDVMYS